MNRAIVDLGGGAILAALCATLALSSCGEPVVEQQVEAGVIDVIDFGFEDAGPPDGGSGDETASVDGCASDGSCG
ncbi:MAG: hypothetical protein ABIJ09_25870 [Pseudomonadota bacterium]